MSDQHPRPDDLNKQTEQARRVLMRLQWLIIVLLGGGIVWLYTAFHAVNDQVDEKLAKIDTVDARLNAMDDRIFSLTSLYGQRPTPQKPQATHEQTIIKVQLDMIKKLHEQGNYDDTINALSALEWQLQHTTGLSTPVKNTLRDALKTDINHLNAQKNQPDAWQSHIIKMHDIQAFLRKQQSQQLTQKDLLLHDASMLMTLAISAANQRDRMSMTTYLQEVKARLEQHVILTDGKLSIGQPNTANNADKNSLAQAVKGMITDTTKSSEQSSNTSDNASNTNELHSINDALYGVYELLANSPKTSPLKSLQILP